MAPVRIAARVITFLMLCLLTEVSASVMPDGSFVDRLPEVSPVQWFVKIWVSATRRVAEHSCDSRYQKWTTEKVAGTFPGREATKAKYRA
jgi:hypothetical protein